VFTRRGGQLLAEKTGCRFLGAISLDPLLSNCIENGLNFLDTLKGSAIMDQLTAIVDLLLVES
jgi:hypothetical protein